jgi:hypothetical protein
MAAAKAGAEATDAAAAARGAATEAATAVAARGGGVFHKFVVISRVVLAFRCVEALKTILSDLFYTLRYSSANATETLKDIRAGVQYGGGVAVVHMGTRLMRDALAYLPDMLRLPTPG